MTTRNSLPQKSAENANHIIFAIDTRYYGASYHARVCDQNFKVSCTASAELAAKSCAEKFCKARKLVLVELKPFTAQTFILTASIAQKSGVPS